MKRSSLSVTFLLLLSISFITPQFMIGSTGATAWGPEQQISTDLGEEAQGQPDIAVEGDEIHVVWADARELRYGIGYQRFDGSEWQPERIIAEETDAGALYPKVAVENGEVHVVYERRAADGNWDIYHAHFDGVDWQPALEISSDLATERQSRPEVEVDSGVVHVVWTDWGEGDGDIYYRRFNGATWEPEEELSTDQGTENQGGPSLDAQDGEVHVVWSSDFNDSYDIYYRHWNGIAWEPEQVIVTDPLKWIQSNPAIAVEGENIYVVWEDQSDSDSDIYFRSFNGTAWQPEQEISSDTTDEGQYGASIAVANGSVHVVWTDFEDGDSDIRYRKFDGATWQPEQEISVDTGSGEQILPSVSVAGDQVHVVWEKQTDGLYYDVSYRHHDGSAWLTIEKRGFDDGPESELYVDISVIDDQVHFIWMDRNDVDNDIFYRYLNGTAWEPELELSTDTLWERQSGPAVAVEDYEVHAVWYGEGPSDDIYYRWFDGSDWQPQAEISTDSGWEDQWSPSVAVRDGKVHVVWSDYGDGDSDIYYRMFSGTWQQEEQISIDAANEDQSSPAIAVEGDRVHVVWQDAGDGDRDIRYRLHNGTGWEAIQEISTDIGTENQYSPAVATGNGKVHVVWHDGKGGDYDIIYRCFDGSWLPEIEITTDAGTEDQFDPDIAAEGDRVYVTWTDEGDGDRDIYYRYFDGTAWRPEEEVSSDEGIEDQRSPAIAVFGGVVHFAWSDMVDGDNDVYYRSAFEDFTTPGSEARRISPQAFGFPFWVPTTWGFSVEWSAEDDEGLASVSLTYRFSPDNSSWSAWGELARNDSVSGTSANGWFYLLGSPDGEGYYEFYTIATDTNGNVEPEPGLPDLIAGVDATAPYGSITIEDDKEWATDYIVTLTLTYSDNVSGVSRARYSDDGVWDDEPWQNATATKLWMLPGPEGTNTVFYQVMDNAGHASPTYSDDIELDTLPPSTTLFSPGDGSLDLDIGTNITVWFTEKMNTTSVEESFRLTAGTEEVEGTFTWLMNGTRLIFDPLEDLDCARTYEIRISNEATDPAGNGLWLGHFSWFTTEDYPPEEGVGQYWWVLVIVFVVIIAAALILLTLRRRRKGETEERSEEE